MPTELESNILSLASIFENNIPILRNSSQLAHRLFPYEI